MKKPAAPAPAPEKLQLKRDQMKADMAKFKGKASNFRTARPKRKTVNRYQ